MFIVANAKANDCSPPHFGRSTSPSQLPLPFVYVRHPQLPGGIVTA
jgi:hypothetical protein